MALNAFERETTINASDGDDLVSIWTAQRTVITKLKKDDRFTLREEGMYDGCPWARFTIPASQWNPATGVKRRSSKRSQKQVEALNRARPAGVPVNA